VSGWRPTHWQPRRPSFVLTPLPHRRRRSIVDLACNPLVGDYFVPVYERWPDDVENYASSDPIVRVDINAFPRKSGEP
jgi:hypothetical protein